MGRPMILYGLVDLTNPSFESNAGGAAPTGWDSAASVNPLASVDATVYQSAGDGIPSARSLKQNVAGGTAGNKTIHRQRFAVSKLPGFVNEGAVEIAAVASLKVARSIAGRNTLLRLKQFDATGTAAPGSGASLSPPEERRFECGGPAWTLRVAAQKVHASAAWVDVELVYDISLGAYDVNAHAWWDRVFVGVLVDLHKGVRSFEMDLDPGFEVNAGNGVAEIVSVAKPETTIDVDIRNLTEDEDPHGDSLALGQFVRWLGRPDVGFLALWGDRDKLTNAHRHFQQVHLDPSISISYPPGFARRNYSYRFVAPSEGAA